MCVFCCVPHSAACLLAEKCNEVPHGVKGAARERERAKGWPLHGYQIIRKIKNL